MPFNIPETEDDSDFDGFLSHRQEWHALSIGIAVGFVSVTPVPKTREFVYRVVGLVDDDGSIDTRSKAMKEAKAQSWYAAGGVVIGVVLALVFGLLAGLGLVTAPEHFDGSLLEWGETFA